MAQVHHDEPAAEQPGSGQIPTFHTVEEEAAFWDTHSLADFAEELEEAPDVQFVPGRAVGAITVRLEDAALTALVAQARRRGVAPAALIRMWVLEHLQAEDFPR